MKKDSNPFPSFIDITKQEPPYKLTIDANRINAQGTLPWMNVLRRWEQEGKVSIHGSLRFRDEAANHSVQPEARSIALMISDSAEPWILGVSCLGECYLTANNGPSTHEITKTLFPRTLLPLSRNRLIDVLHILSHYYSGRDVFLTDNHKDFIHDKKQKDVKRIEMYRRWRIVVLFDHELVDLLARRHGWSNKS